MSMNAASGVAGMRRSGARAHERRSLVYIAVAFLIAPFGLLELRPAVIVPLFAVLSLVPCVMLVRGGASRSQTLAAAIVSAAYFLACPVAYLTTGLVRGGSFDAISTESIDLALLWSWRGYLCFLLGYLVASQFSKSSAASADIRRRYRNAHGLAMVLGISSLLATLVEVVVSRGVPFRFLSRSESGFKESSLQMMVHYPERLGFAFLFLYVTVKIAGRGSRALDWLFLFVVAAYLILAAGSGSKAIFISLILSVFLPLLLVRRRWSWRQLFGGVVVAGAVYVVFGLVSDYRVIVRMSPPADDLGVSATLEYQMEKFSEALRTTAGGIFTADGIVSPAGVEPSVSAQMISRSGSSLRSFASLLEITGGVSPQENSGNSVLTPLFAFVPRSLYSEKPHFFDSGDHAAFYYWTSGGISVSLMGSLYWAWSFPGVCIGMAILGMTLAALSRRAASSMASWPVYSGLWILIILAVADSGVTFHAIATDLVRLGLLLLILSRFVVPVLRPRARVL